MTGQEARDDERGALERVLFDGLRRGLTVHEIVTTVLREGFRKHPEPEMEYEVTYSSAEAPSVDGYALRRTSGVMTDLGKAREFAAVARNPMLRARTKGVPAGPWVPVGEGEQG